MSSTSSIETPTTPKTPPQQQHQHEHTTTAIVASQQQKRKSQNAKGSSSNTHSSATSPLVTENSFVIAQAQALLPSSSSSTNCTDTIAAVHEQRKSYSLVKKQPSLRYQGKQIQLLANSPSTMTSSEPAAGPSLANDASASILSPPDVSSHCCSNIKANITPLTSQKMHRTIPSDKINLRLILVSGKTKEFIFNPSDSAGDIAQTVFDNWPEDWTREAVSKADILRLIYQGRFLHCNVTLGALGLPLGKTTVMHLVPRDNLPEPNSQDQRQNSKGGSGRCCSTNCCIL
ncbi:hypothetical protein KR054_003395 [Drosophila jambulina]|nr:hypothetical protein KR054_003395 [Drosophila jambulina]